MEDEAYKYARNLLFEICRRDCPEKEVEALDDTIGVLTQIDHMTAHLFSRIEALKARVARDMAISDDRFESLVKQLVLTGASLAKATSRAEKAEAERDAARDAALEESAKMVDVFFGQNAFADADLYKWGTASGAQAIAAAIRAMKGKSQ